MERCGSCACPVRSTAFGVGEGESCVSPVRCSQAVWNRILYGLGARRAGLFTCIQRHRGIERQPNIPGGGGRVSTAHQHSAHADNTSGFILRTEVRMLLC